jgi:hypothetical protein
MRIKSFYALCVFLITVQATAQMQELIDNNWYLQYVTFDNETYYMPGSPPGGEPFYFPHIEFSATEMYAIVTFNYCLGDVVYDSNEAEFTTIDPILTLGDCESLCELEGFYLGAFLFKDGNSTTFNYEFITDPDGNYLLHITDSDANIAVFWDQAHSLSVDDLSNTTFSLYPNPASEIIYLSSNNQPVASTPGLGCLRNFGITAIKRRGTSKKSSNHIRFRPNRNNHLYKYSKPAVYKFDWRYFVSYN